MSEETPTHAESLDRYGAGVKWLVSLATGTVALGIGFFEGEGLTEVERYLFLSAGAALLVAVVAGVFCGLHVIGGASYGEAVQRMESAPEEAPPEEVERHRKQSEHSTKLANLLFRVTVWSFAVGMLAFGAFGAVLVWKPDGDPAVGPDLTLVAPGDGDAIPALFYDRRTGTFYALTAGAAGGLRLVPVPVERRERAVRAQPGGG